MSISQRRRRSWLKWILVALFLSPAVLSLVHLVRGGTDLSPPMWTDADLIPLPEPSKNAWESIGSLETLPRLGIELDCRRGDLAVAATSSEVAAGLARPEVLALLERAPQVLGRTQLADPNALDLETHDLIRFVVWHRWIALSAAAIMREEPEAAAQTLASLFSLSIDCANAARATSDYRICARLAERTLELMLDFSESPEGDSNVEVDEVLAAVLRTTPSLSTKNALMGQHVSVHGHITSMLQDNKWSAPLLTDLRATFAELDEGFLVDPEDRCTRWRALRKRSSFRQAFGYNSLGNVLLSGFGTLDCAHFPSVREAESAVAEQRKALLTQVQLRSAQGAHGQ